MKIELYSDFLIRNAIEKGDQEAVIAADASYTYTELNRAVNRFANGLKKRGVKAGDRVMVALPKDSKPFVAMFGIMKIGAVLIPVGMDYPEGRIKKIRDDSEAVMLVGVEGGIGDTLFEDIFNDGTEDEPERPPIDSMAPCMILYTSGSTGNPKGVMLRHHGYVVTGEPLEDNLLSWNTHLYGHTFLGVTTTTFAFFYMEYCFALANGCKYVMVDLEHSRSPMLMAEAMKEHGVDVIAGTPSRILQYLEIPVFEEAIKNCHILIIGGERVPVGMAEAVHAVSPDCHILNGYSQTEGNCPIIVAEVESAESHGFACHDWKLAVVDNYDKEVENGVKGELLLSGDNMMAGYVNLPEEMEAKTVYLNGEKYFRTGDSVIRFDDGGYIIIGRMDQQIKLRGLRMEPGEIEKVIQNFPDTRIEKAVVRVNVIHNTEHLCAYYTGLQKVDEESLRKHLKYELPAYMIPDYFMFLENMPLNQNGKIDYKNLPEIKIDDLEIIAPANEIERSLLDKCKQIVEFDAFGVTSPLEEVGFTSLTFIELASDVLDNYHVELRLTDLMAGGFTVRSIADQIKNASVEEKAEKKKLDKYPLTPQLYQFTTENPMGDMYRKFTFKPEWNDAEAIRAAFAGIINSFPYLYTTFRKEGDTWYQIPYTGELLSEADFPIIDGEPTEEEIDAFCVPYDIETADRLFDIRIYRGEKVIVLMHIQHILMDHVFVEKLAGYISQALRKPDFRPAEQVDYFEYTMDVLEMGEETDNPNKPETTSEAHPVEAPQKMQGYVEIGKMTSVLNKYRLQPADYLFGLTSQAYLNVMGQDEAVIFDMFGGRNEARYFNTAGYFPVRIPVRVKKDPKFYEHVGKDVVAGIAAARPADDCSYRALVKNEYVWPNITYNCMEYIEETKDFELISLFSKQEKSSALTKANTPHVYFYCFIIEDKAAVINLHYDPAVLDEEKAKEILTEVRNLAEKNAFI